MMRCSAGMAGLVMLATGLAAAEIRGQEAEESRGWLGVGVQELMQCRVLAPGEDSCWRRLVVAQVVVNGPADRAGVQPGDTILALDGDRLEDGMRDDAFRSLKPGTPVRLEVGRRDGRLTLRLVPGGRPTGTIAVRVPIAPGETRVVRRPLPGPLSSVPRAGPERPRFLIRSERGGLYQIEPQVEVRLLGVKGEGALFEPGPEEGGEEARQTRALEARLPGYEGDGELVPLRARYIQLELGPELKALQDSVFRTARVRLDSLYRALRGDDRRYRTLVELLRRRAGGQLSWTLGFGRSVAGAEFEPLSPELAEFFQGAREGLLCLRVIEGTPADRVGLRPGDVVVEAAGRPVASLEDLRASFRSAAGRGIELKWVRKGRLMQGKLRY